MFALPSLIANAAQQAGMKVPADPDGAWKSEEFPHFFVFCSFQLGCETQPGDHWHNAKVVAEISESTIRQTTYGDLRARGAIMRPAKILTRFNF